MPQPPFQSAPAPLPRTHAPFCHQPPDGPRRHPRCRLSGRQRQPKTLHLTAACGEASKGPPSRRPPGHSPGFANKPREKPRSITPSGGSKTSKNVIDRALGGVEGFKKRDRSRSRGGRGLQKTRCLSFLGPPAPPRGAMRVGLGAPRPPARGDAGRFGGPPTPREGRCGSLWEPPDPPQGAMRVAFFGPRPARRGERVRVFSALARSGWG